MSRAVICEGCGRAPGAREVYCSACGRELPGREAPAGSDAAPPGWLVAAGARGEGGFFEPLPSVPVQVADPLAPRRSWPAADGPEELAAAGRDEDSGASGELDGGPGWRVRESPAPPPPLPPALRPVIEAAGNGAVLVVAPRRAPLHLLYAPLLALVMLSSCGAVALLVLHVALHR